MRACAACYYRLHEQVVEGGSKVAPGPEPEPAGALDFDESQRSRRNSRFPRLHGIRPTACAQRVGCRAPAGGVTEACEPLGCECVPTLMLATDELGAGVPYRPRCSGSPLRFVSLIGFIRESSASWSYTRAAMLRSSFGQGFHLFSWAGLQETECVWRASPRIKKSNVLTAQMRASLGYDIRQ